MCSDVRDSYLWWFRHCIYLLLSTSGCTHRAVMLHLTAVSKQHAHSIFGVDDFYRTLIPNSDTAEYVGQRCVISTAERERRTNNNRTKTAAWCCFRIRALRFAARKATNEGSSGARVNCWRTGGGIPFTGPVLGLGSTMKHAHTGSTVLNFDRHVLQFKLHP